mgnify:FL=1
MYLLIHLLGISNIDDINYIEKSNNILIFTFKYNNITVKINYNRDWDGQKTKIIKMDNNIIDLSIPQNDPLQESINMCLLNKADFEYNHYLSLETIKLLEIFL